MTAIDFDLHPQKQYLTVILRQMMNRLFSNKDLISLMG